MTCFKSGVHPRQLQCLHTFGTVTRQRIDNKYLPGSGERRFHVVTLLFHLREKLP